MKNKKTDDHRYKLEMADEVAQIIHYLHMGSRETADPLIQSLKTHSLRLDEEIQQDVLAFAEQVHFQYDYDPWHKISPEVKTSADRLIRHLGFSPPQD
jgi:hypothetical protein